MGPPKSRPPRKTYDEILIQYDTFEQRVDLNSNQPYLVNPHTGETIHDYQSPHFDRAYSMWIPPPKVSAPGTIMYHMYPAFYASRRWGRRQFIGWNDDKHAAATHIAAVTRGYQARTALRTYFKGRYYKKQCRFSGWYYYHDTWHYDPNNETEASSWYKPRLAFPDDIEEYEEPDPEDYLGKDRYTYPGFEQGPYQKITVGSMGNPRRVKHIAFSKPDVHREEALKHVNEIDLETSPLGSVIHWMEGLKTGTLHISDYTNMRVATKDNDWQLVYDQMEKYKHRPLTHAYALYAFSKMEFPYEKDGGLNIPSVDAWNHCLELIDDPYGKLSPTLLVFALYTLEKFFSVPAGRALFWDSSSVKGHGKKRQKMIEEFFQQRMRLFTNIIDGMKYDHHTFKGKAGSNGQETSTTIYFPSGRAVDSGSLALSCLALLGQEQEHRELMSETVTKSCIDAMMKCEEEPTIQLRGCQLLYNMCYRCQAAQLTILMADTKPLIHMLKNQFSGDPEILTMTRRIELALTPDGFRGAVEKQMEREFKEELRRLEHDRPQKPSDRHK